MTYLDPVQMFQSHRDKTSSYDNCVKTEAHLKFYDFDPENELYTKNVEFTLNDKHKIYDMIIAVMLECYRLDKKDPQLMGYDLYKVNTRRYPGF